MARSAASSSARRGGQNRSVPVGQRDSGTEPTATPRPPCSATLDEVRVAGQCSTRGGCCDARTSGGRGVGRSTDGGISTGWLVKWSATSLALVNCTAGLLRFLRWKRMWRRKGMAKSVGCLWVRNEVVVWKWEIWCAGGSRDDVGKVLTEKREVLSGSVYIQRAGTKFWRRSTGERTVARTRQSPFTRDS